MRYLAMFGALLAAPVLGAVRTETVEYKDGDVVLQGTLAYDDAAEGPRPGVLVCHEWWGNNDYSRSRAEQLAGLGYVAFALDMYGKGVTTTDPKKAAELAGNLRKDPDALRRRAAAGLKVLAESERVDASRLGAIGYCMGGMVALELARSGADLDVVVSFHGPLGTSRPAGKGGIKAKVMACNGAADPMVSLEERAAFEKEMSDAGVDYVVVEYGGAVHAFTNPAADSAGVPGVAYNGAADRRSWEHMRAFLAEGFAPEQPGR